MDARDLDPERLPAAHDPRGLRRTVQEDRVVGDPDLEVPGRGRRRRHGQAGQQDEQQPERGAQPGPPHRAPVSPRREPRAR
ncbi:hypothetical protein GKE82_03045 [Conexibacter sp. W3-3-2]|uniref:hypothetical protein n=1 Tax=Conexibacter sp. W3-3-2 TaxID=2675227 RepID=UPI0012B9B3A9|nr:hypothetical protein [Conexibacter sp. W3-3-2]MTD43310.1 hypothetical protein [Conexibacter sp. W3-3-2]